MKKIFIIHGWTYNLDKWQDLAALLKKNDIEPVLLKVPGLTEPSDQVWNIDGYIDWLDKQLAGQKQPIIVGHSNGGRIALSYIQKHPGVIGQLILVDSAGVPHQQAKSRAKLKILRVISKVGKVFSHIPIVKKVFYKLIGAQDYMNAPPNMKVTMQNMLNADTLIDLSKIKVPTSIIWGRDDTITPLADGKVLEAGIAGAKLYIVDNARHAPMGTHAEEVAKLITDLVQKGNT